MHCSSPPSSGPPILSFTFIQIFALWSFALVCLWLLTTQLQSLVLVAIIWSFVSPCWAAWWKALCSAEKAFVVLLPTHKWHIVILDATTKWCTASRGKWLKCHNINIRNKSCGCRSVSLFLWWPLRDAPYRPTWIARFAVTYESHETHVLDIHKHIHRCVGKHEMLTYLTSWILYTQIVNYKAEKCCT